MFDPELLKNAMLQPGELAKPGVFVVTDKGIQRAEVYNKSVTLAALVIARKTYHEAVKEHLKTIPLDKYAFGHLRDELGYDAANEVMDAEVNRRHWDGVLTEDEMYHHGHRITT